MAKHRTKTSKGLGTEDTFAKVRRFSLPGAIAEEIHSAILSGKLTPGQRITEDAVCKQMGVSRTSVREALQELRVLGVLAARNRRTYIAPEPDIEEIKDVYFLRGVCEGMAAVGAKKRMRKGDLQRLESLVRQMEESAQSGDSVGFRRADLSFHELIWRIDGKQYLERLLKALTHPYIAYLAALIPRSGHLTLVDIAKLHREFLNNLRRFSGRKLQAQVGKLFRTLGRALHIANQNGHEKPDSKRRQAGFGG